MQVVFSQNKSLSYSLVITGSDYVDSFVVRVLLNIDRLRVFKIDRPNSCLVVNWHYHWTDDNYIAKLFVTKASEDYWNFSFVKGSAFNSKIRSSNSHRSVNDLGSTTYSGSCQYSLWIHSAGWLLYWAMCADHWIAFKVLQTLVFLFDLFLFQESILLSELQPFPHILLNSCQEVYHMQHWNPKGFEDFSSFVLAFVFFPRALHFSPTRLYTSSHLIHLVHFSQRLL